MAMVMAGMVAVGMMAARETWGRLGETWGRLGGGSAAAVAAAVMAMVMVGTAVGEMESAVGEMVGMSVGEMEATVGEMGTAVVGEMVGEIVMAEREWVAMAVGTEGAMRAAGTEGAARAVKAAVVAWVGVVMLVVRVEEVRAAAAMAETAEAEKGVMVKVAAKVAAKGVGRVEGAMGEETVAVERAEAVGVGMAEAREEAVTEVEIVDSSTT